MEDPVVVVVYWTLLVVRVPLPFWLSLWMDGFSQRSCS